MASEYVTCFSQFCSKNPQLKRPVGLPNVQRLMELYSNTIALFVHATLVAEIGLESMSQPLKAALYRNTKSESQIPAFFQVLGRDWVPLVADTRVILVTSTEEMKKIVMNCLKFLFFGSDTQHILATNQVDDEALISDMYENILESFRNPVRGRVLKLYGTNVSIWASDGAWFGNSTSYRDGVMCHTSEELDVKFYELVICGA